MTADLDLNAIRARLALWDLAEVAPCNNTIMAEMRDEEITEAMLNLAHDVEPLLRANAQLTAERDRARDIAAALEAKLGRVQALHAGEGKDKSTFAWRVDVTPGGGIALGERAWKWCPECRTEWPCSTTLAISSQA